jgi:hypothetical protein
VEAVIDFNQSHGVKFRKTAVFDDFHVAAADRMENPVCCELKPTK